MVRQRIEWGGRLITYDDDDRFATADLFWDGGIHEPYHVNGYNVGYYDGHANWLAVEPPIDDFIDSWGNEVPVFIVAADENF